MSFKDAIRRRLQRLLNEPRLPCARVLPADGLVIEVLEAGGSCQTYNFDGVDRSRATVGLENADVRIWLDGKRRAAANDGQPQEPASRPDWQYTGASPVEAQELYRSIQKTLRRSTRKAGAHSSGMLKPALIGAAAGLAMILIGMPSQAPATLAAADATTVAAASAPAPSNVPPQASVTAEEAKLLASLKGIRMPGSGPVYWVFSDPNCPFCKALDKSIGAVTEFQAVMLPLGYKPGSRDLAAAALCASDPAKEWSQAIAGTSKAKPCEKGYAIVDANMRAFEQMRLTGTPTMVTPKGLLVSGAASPDELRLALR